MSEGPRIPLATADQVLAAIIARWGASLEVVGSVRRRRHVVGDLELVAPLPEGWDRKHVVPADDQLFRVINATMEKPWTSGALFGGDAEPAAVSPMGRIERGLKPGFVAASLMLRPFRGHPTLDVEMPCQIYRYTAKNRGWKLIEYTGPKEFGIHFLVQWKKRYGIPVGDEKHPASVKGHLVDVTGAVIAVKDEEQAFQLAGMRPVPPEQRDEYAERAKALWEARRA